VIAGGHRAFLPREDGLDKGMDIKASAETRGQVQGSVGFYEFDMSVQDGFSGVSMG